MKKEEEEMQRGGVRQEGEGSGRGRSQGGEESGGGVSRTR